MCFDLIRKNKPAGSPEDPEFTHNEDGERVPFTKELYHERVEGDPDQLACPYRSLYQGFERDYAFFKILLMLFKFAMVVPLIVFASKFSDKDQTAALFQSLKRERANKKQ